MLYSPEEFCERVQITPDFLADLNKEGFVPNRLKIEEKECELYESLHVLIYSWTSLYLLDGLSLSRALHAAYRATKQYYIEPEYLLEEAMAEIPLMDEPETFFSK